MTVKSMEYLERQDCQRQKRRRWCDKRLITSPKMSSSLRIASLVLASSTIESNNTSPSFLSSTDASTTSSMFESWSSSDSMRLTPIE
ncbi:hypothetical protein Ae201684_012672 [Aphanomyces euteiches]|uniref:Uncharacterized protein n=1 Tax=Aphanomyces euteiches TaxID=100861 RepID=A0A6G0WQU0_9STRA|nr:hypothetical protein Ae201684_012672 [Aphanomyces euteiches]